MRRAKALIGSALALTLALSGCAGSGGEANVDTPAGAPTTAARMEGEVGQESTAEGGAGVTDENNPTAQENIPTGAAAGQASTPVSTLPTAVNVPAPNASPVASESGGPVGGAGAEGFGTVPFTRTETVIVAGDGTLSAQEIRVAAGEPFLLSLTNAGSGPVLMRVPLGDAGELAVLLPSSAMAGSASAGTVGATSSSETGSTEATGGAQGTTGAQSGTTGGTNATSNESSGDNAANSTTGAAGNSGNTGAGTGNTGNTTGQGGVTGGPAAGVDTTGGGNDSIITDPAAAVPTIEAAPGNTTEGSQLGSAGQGSDSGAVAGTVGSQQGGQPAQAAPVTLLMRFTQPGTYAIVCEPMGAMGAGTGVGGATSSQPQQSEADNAGQNAGGEAQNSDAENGNAGQNAGDAQNAGCSGQITIVVGEAASGDAPAAAGDTGATGDAGETGDATTGGSGDATTGGSGTAGEGGSGGSGNPLTP